MYQESFVIKCSLKQVYQYIYQYCDTSQLNDTSAQFYCSTRIPGSREILRIFPDSLHRVEFTIRVKDISPQITVLATAVDESTNFLAGSIGNFDFENVRPYWEQLKSFLISKETESDGVQTDIKKPGRKTMACNIWVDYIVNVKNKPVGSNNDKNEIFKMWKQLYKLENDADPDDPDVLAEPWESYREAIRTGRHFKPKK
ncbi:MAG: hypothetical protein H6641_18415 [Caldilineaceae bacterium]|nr:hypothetical protein [Caldilineaceae bacterium]